MNKDITEIREILDTNNKLGLMDTKEYHQIEQALKNIEDSLNTKAYKIKSLQATNETLREEITKQENGDDNEQELIKDSAILPYGTLENVSKNRILQNLHENCSLEQLENLEKQAKTAVQHNGILYKEVL